MSIEQVTIQPILAGLIDEMEPLATHSGVRIEVEHPDNLPDARVDPERVKQVVRNLLDNAIKHTPADGSVVLRTRAEKDSILLEVSDTGIGIPSDRMAMIFQGFTRFSEGDRDRDSGSGLGLVVSRRLVIALGGKISVDSREGHGTTFTVQLPQWPEDDD
jgi:two-component system sensor histidine kinase ResE